MGNQIAVVTKTGPVILASAATILKTTLAIALMAAPAAASLTTVDPPSTSPASTLTISVSPLHSFIVPGHITTCSELDAKPTNSGSTTDDGDSSGLLQKEDSAVHLTERVPVVGSLRFPKFTLDYTGAGELRFSYAIVRITLPDQDFELTMNDAELQNLLAITELKITGPTHIVSNDATDSRRQEPSAFAPCGLVANDIPLTKPELSFTAQVEIRLSGYEVDASGNEVPLEAVTTADVDYAQ